MKPVVALLMALSAGFPANSQPPIPIKPNDSNGSGSTLPGSFDKSRHTIRPGDTLLVRVWRQPRLGGAVVVTDEGRISLPVIGTVTVEGLTTSGLAEMYKRRLQARVESPNVAVSFVALAGWTSASSRI